MLAAADMGVDLKPRNTVIEVHGRSRLYRGPLSWCGKTDHKTNFEKEVMPMATTFHRAQSAVSNGVGELKGLEKYGDPIVVVVSSRQVFQCCVLSLHAYTLLMHLPPASCTTGLLRLQCNGMFCGLNSDPLANTRHTLIICL